MGDLQEPQGELLAACRVKMLEKNATIAELEAHNSYLEQQAELACGLRADAEKQLDELREDLDMPDRVTVRAGTLVAWGVIAALAGGSAAMVFRAIWRMISEPA